MLSKQGEEIGRWEKFGWGQGEKLERNGFYTVLLRSRYFFRLEGVLFRSDLLLEHPRTTSLLDFGKNTKDLVFTRAYTASTSCICTPQSTPTNTVNRCCIRAGRGNRGCNRHKPRGEPPYCTCRYCFAQMLADLTFVPFFLPIVESPVGGSLSNI